MKPQHTIKRSNAGVKLAEEGRWEEAIAEFDEALKREANRIVSTRTVKTHWLNLAVIGLSGLLLAALIGYVLVENIAHSAVG